MSTGQPLTGERASTPKMLDVKLNGSTGALMKKMGNGHFVNFIWTDVVSLSGTSVVLASGVSYHGKAFASYANITATPRAEINQNYYIDYDTVNNVVSLKAAGSVTADFNIHIVLP